MIRVFSIAILLLLASGAVARPAAVRIVSEGQRFEPMQNITPASPSRHVSNYEHRLVWAPEAGLVREDWALRVVYPFPGTWSWSMHLDRDQGRRVGRDGWRPGEGGEVPPARAGAVWKDIWLANPSILAAHAKLLAETGTESGHLRRLYAMDGIVWTLDIDPAGGRPLAASVEEADPLHGTVENRIEFGDWRTVAGIDFPFRLEQFIDGRLIRREIRQEIVADPADWRAIIGEVKGAAAADDAERERGFGMSQFFLRRVAMGAPADENQSANVGFNETGPGIWQITGSSHLNLLVEGETGLLLADAVWYPERSRAILAALAERWPNKPLRAVVLTHHHLDHVGGLEPFAEAGATIVLSAANAEWFRKVLEGRIDQVPPILAAGDSTAFDLIGRKVETYAVPNSHASGMLAVYVPDARLLYNSDLYSPGRAIQQPVWAEELLAATRFYGLDIALHLGGHGKGTLPHQALVDLVAEATKTPQ